MRIVAVDTFCLRAPLAEPFGFSQAWYNARTAMLVRLTDSEGRIGWGEAFGPPEPVAAIINHLLAPLVLEADSFDPAPLWERAYARTRDYGQKGLVINAISAVDIAIWDLKGQALGVSVSRLLGGRFREEIEAYATGLYFRTKDDFTDELVAEAQAHVAAGFGAMKLKIGLTPERDLAHARAVRDAIGPAIRLMVDANHAYDAATAIRLGHELADLDIGWFEEPVIPEDIEAYKEVRSALSIPIAGGEAEYTRFGFRRLLSERAVDIVQPDLTIAGGFTECQRIAAMASAWGVRYLPHVWGSAVGFAASLQFAASLLPATQSLNPIEPIFEFDRTPNPFRDDLVLDRPAIADGSITIPDRPGLGLEINEAVIREYLVKGN